MELLLSLPEEIVFALHNSLKAAVFLILKRNLPLSTKHLLSFCLLQVHICLAVHQIRFPLGSLSFFFISNDPWQFSPLKDY